MKKTLEQMINEKYGVAMITEDDFHKLSEGMTIAIGAVNELSIKDSMLLRDKMVETIATVMNVKKEVLECLTIENIDDMFKKVESRDELTGAMVELIKIYEGSKKVGAERYYSVMSTKRWYDEYNYWVFEDDNEEEMQYLGSFKSVKNYGVFRYTCHIEFEI